MKAHIILCLIFLSNLIVCNGNKFKEIKEFIDFLSEHYEELYKKIIVDTLKEEEPSSIREVIEEEQKIIENLSFNKIGGMDYEYFPRFILNRLKLISTNSNNKKLIQTNMLSLTAKFPNNWISFKIMTKLEDGLYYFANILVKYDTKHDTVDLIMTDVSTHIHMEDYVCILNTTYILNGVMIEKVLIDNAPEESSREEFQKLLKYLDLLSIQQFNHKMFGK